MRFISTKNEKTDKTIQDIYVHLSYNSIIPFKITSEIEPNKIPFRLQVADFQNCDNVSKIATFF